MDDQKAQGTMLNTITITEMPIKTTETFFLHQCITRGSRGCEAIALGRGEGQFE